MSTEQIEVLSPGVMPEILRRRELALAHPELLELWGDTTERLRAKLKAICQQKIKLTAADSHGLP